MSDTLPTVSAEGLELNVDPEVATHAKRFYGPAEAASGAAETEAHAKRFYEPSEASSEAAEVAAHARLFIAFPPELAEQRYELVYRPAAPGGRPEVELHSARANR